MIAMVKQVPKCASCRNRSSGLFQIEYGGDGSLDEQVPLCASCAFSKQGKNIKKIRLLATLVLEGKAPKPDTDPPPQKWNIDAVGEYKLEFRNQGDLLFHLQHQTDTPMHALEESRQVACKFVDAAKQQGSKVEYGEIERRVSLP